MKKWIAVAALGLIGSTTMAQTKEQIDAYVESHKDLAISEMYRSGIPASITLAQGILETAAGTSPLYMRSNNNFGIKCKSNWTGKFTYHDDDAKGECFRVYENDSLSYVDHSNFLKTASRYNFLFELDKTDYKSWAIGLRKAGYATNPAYASILIKHIEENNLQQFDGVSQSNYSSSNGIDMMKRSKTNSSTQNINSSNPSSNLPTADYSAGDNKTDDFPVVHWNVSNVSDATNGYTVTPVANNRYPVYSSKTRSRYTRAKLHNISYGNAKRSNLKKRSNGTAYANKTVAKRSTTVAKSSGKKAPVKYSASAGGRKSNQHYTRN